MTNRNHGRRVGQSRRTLLKGIGAGAALGPLLPLLNVSGQEMVFPKRLLLFFTPDGTASVDHGGMLINWKPVVSGSSFTLQSIHTPLEPIKPKIVIPWGLKFSAGGAGQEHAFGMAGMWSGYTLHGPSADANFDGGNGNRTGWGGGATIDQIVAPQPVRTAPTPARRPTRSRRPPTARWSWAPSAAIRTARTA